MKNCRSAGLDISGSGYELCAGRCEPSMSPRALRNRGKFLTITGRVMSSFMEQREVFDCNRRVNFSFTEDKKIFDCKNRVNSSQLTASRVNGFNSAVCCLHQQEF